MARLLWSEALALAAITLLLGAALPSGVEWWRVAAGVLGLSWLISFAVKHGVAASDSVLRAPRPLTDPEKSRLIREKAKDWLSLQEHDPWVTDALKNVAAYGIQASGFLVSFVQKGLCEQIASEAGLEPASVWPGSWDGLLGAVQRELKPPEEPGNSLDDYREVRAAREAHHRKSGDEFRARLEAKLRERGTS